MGRRGEHTKEEYREMALVAAEQLVIKSGLQGLTARKVASAIGYTVGSLYLVFKNLDDLILQVNARTLDEMYAYLLNKIEDKINSDDVILASAHAYVSYAMEHKNRWMMVFEHKPPEGNDYPDWYMEKIAEIFALVDRTVNPHPNEGGAEMSMTSQALWSGVHGICILALMRNYAVLGINDVRPVVDSLVMNYLAGTNVKKTSAA